jgi:hypothetical protein
MSNIIVRSFAALIILSGTAIGKLNKVDYYQYCGPAICFGLPSYTAYLNLFGCQAVTQFNLVIRQPSLESPGDYFWPPDALAIREHLILFNKSELTASEKEQISAFIHNSAPKSFSDSSVLESLTGYEYSMRGTLRHYKYGDRREVYSMLYEGDGYGLCYLRLAGEIFIFLSGRTGRLPFKCGPINKRTWQNHAAFR